MDSVDSATTLVLSGSSNATSKIFEDYLTAYFGPRNKSRPSFKTFVMKLLSKYVENQGKILVGHGATGAEYSDALAPVGIDDMPGPTAVAIWEHANKAIIEFQAKVLPILTDPNVHKSLLVVVLARVTPDVQQIITTSFQERNIKIPITMWGIDKIAEIAARYAEYVTDIAPELAAVAVSNIVEKSLETKPDDWKHTRDRYVAQLRGEYRDNGLVLILGAGVSLSTTKVPSWDNLLSRLFIAMIESKLPDALSARPEEKEYLVKKLHSFHNAFPLIEAHYIRAGLEDSFAEAVAKALYTDIGIDGDATSTLLDALAQLCVPRRKGPNIRAVVTYNFDDLLEKHLERLGLEYRTIYRDVDVAKEDELGIYHVHGFLPREAEQYEGLSDSLLVFSEEGYHTLFQEPYSWSNITQLNFFRENTCVLVGLSLTDPNLRRLLDIAARKSNSPRHYAFLKREWSSTDKPDNKKVRHAVVQAFTEVHYRIQETAFRQLGVNIIWYEDHNDIPEILNSLRIR